MLDEKNFFDTKTIIIAVLAVATAALIYLQFGTGGVMGSLSGQKAAEAALAYINSEMLAGQATATLSGDIKTENGLYKFTIKVGENEIPSYVTRDGKLLFPQAIEIKNSTTTPAEGAATEGPAVASTCEEIQKTEQPLLEAFVVSYCPFGLQMQRILTEVAKGAPELASNIKISYMGAVTDGKITSMHGDQEAQENLRQICLREEQSNKFFPYLTCFLQEGKTDDCLATTKVDVTSLTTCLENPEQGLKYAQADFDNQNKYKVEGSPSLFLNGLKVSEFDFGGRTAKAVGELLCCGFAEKPAVCSNALPGDQAATSFSATYAGANGSSTDASCGE